MTLATVNNVRAPEGDLREIIGLDHDGLDLRKLPT